MYEVDEISLLGSSETGKSEEKGAKNGKEKVIVDKL